MIPKLIDTSLDEVARFVRSLTAERQHYDANTKLIINTAVLIRGVRISGELVAIGGITKAYDILYNTFYIVRTEWQGHRIGSTLAQGNHEFAEQHDLHLLLTVVTSANVPAMRITDRLNYRRITEHDGQVYLFVAFDQLGKALGSVLLPTAIRLYLSPICRPVRVLHERKYREDSAGGSKK